MAWSSENRAAKTTWTTLMVLDQIAQAFEESGEIKMSRLVFWNAAQSAAARRSQAEALSIQIDRVFREVRGAEFEDGQTRLRTLEAVVGVLTSADLTVADLASLLDEHYRFWREGNTT